MDAKADGTLAAEQTKWLGAPTGPLPDSWAAALIEPVADAAPCR